MRREHLEHVIRAAAAVTDEDDLIVIGSQAILGSIADPPPELVGSIEVDLYPRHAPQRAADIDGSIGDGSIFLDTFGYYAHGVGPETAHAPAGWLDRLVPVSNENTRGATGWCMEPHDLVVSKLAAGRDKDIAFARAALSHGIVDPDVLAARIDLMSGDAKLLAHVRELLALARS